MVWGERMDTRKYSESVVKDILQWVESSLNTTLPVEFIAEKSGYSRWHFQRLFKQTTGVALGEYVRARRLSCAAIDLKLTSRTVLDIALQYGFNSQQTFTRAFKNKFHLPPGRYRKQGIGIYQRCVHLYFQIMRRDMPMLVNDPVLISMIEDLTDKYNKMQDF
jgi:AraC-like DNA-binding protein